MNASSPSVLTIDIVSDVVCPWCYLGAKRLQKAIAMRPAVSVQVNWRPFQLDTTIPAGGFDRQDYMLKKFGDTARIDAVHERLSALGQDDGIVFHFERIKRAPNTLDAHRLIRWAQVQGMQNQQLQTAVAMRLFALYFTEGADIGDHAVLRTVAQEAGMDADSVAERLAGEWDKQEVVEEIGVATRIGVTGVPFFIIDGRFGVPGAQEAEVLAGAIDKALVPEA